MKSLYFSALFFVLIFAVVSHADNHDHLIKSSSNGGDSYSLIRLPLEEEADENNKQQQQQKQQTQLETTSFSNSHVIDVEKYLTELMNRRPVMLPTRFRFPHRCGHRFRRFGPGIQVGPGDDMASIFKKRADVIRQRHVSGRFFGGEDGGEFLIIPVKHFHRFHHGVRDHDHDHHHHGEVDPTVEMKREYEFEVKEEYDGHHHHHQHHHHGHDDEVEENNGIMKKILKFLPRF